MITRWKDGSGWVGTDLFGSATGMPVIIACNGPSIAAMETAKFCGPGRLVIGVNNVYPRLRPDVWVGMDEPSTFPASLFEEPFPKILRAPHFASPMQDGCMVKWGRRTMFAAVDPDADFYDWTEKAKARWMNNSFSIAVQAALWMGSREIYFAGVDMHHRAGDYADHSSLTAEQRASNALLHEHLVAFLRQFAARAPRIGVRLTSCSPESRLNEVLSYEHIAKVLARYTPAPGL